MEFVRLKDVSQTCTKCDQSASGTAMTVTVPLPVVFPGVKLSGVHCPNDDDTRLRNEAEAESQCDD